MTARVAAITGASSGIGAATARTLDTGVRGGPDPEADEGKGASS